MAYTAKHRFARISPTKARPVANLVKGMGVIRALETLKFSPLRAAAMIDKVLRSALGNAGISADEVVSRARARSTAASSSATEEAANYVVASVTVDGGPVATGTKRFIPVARGMAHPIRKRTSHITVTIDEISTEEEQ